MNTSGLHNRSDKIKKLALNAGFDFCGISNACYLAEEAPRLEKWLRRNMHGEMAYMANHFDKRLDPSKLMDGARSVISLIHNYYPQKDVFNNGSYKIARYAYGEDYHHVIKRKLNDLFKNLCSEFEDVQGRVFVDSAPVMERQWAARAGLGWIGKNTLLLNRNMGSYFFLAEIITDLELEPDLPVKDYCGSCRKCIDACPTEAISPYELDATKCISYLTIELKNDIPAEFKGKYKDWIFGCDICQEVCPWNRFSYPHKEQAFHPNPAFENMKKTDWEDVTEEVFKSRFHKSPLLRAKHKGLKRNILFLDQNRDRLKDHMESDEPVDY